MPRIGYFIIVNGQDIQNTGFEKFPFLSCREWKIAEAGCALAPCPRPNTQIG